MANFTKFLMFPIAELQKHINDFGKTPAQIEFERTLSEMEMIAGSIDKLAMSEKINNTVDVLARYAGHLPNSDIRRQVAWRVKGWLLDGHIISSIDDMLDAYDLR